MTSERQMEYIRKLQRWKAAELDLVAVQAMSEEEASVLIDDLKARKSVSDGQDRAAASPKPRGVVVPVAPVVPVGRLPLPGPSHLALQVWNPIQAGMVKKAAAEWFLSRDEALNEERFTALCVQLYGFFEAADARIKKKFPEVER